MSAKHLPATLLAAALAAAAPAAVTVLDAAPAAAQEIQYLESNTDWHAFRYTENGNPVCYMVSRPKSDEGDYTQRGDIFAMITHRPAEGETNAMSIIAGYPYRDGSTVEVSIDGDQRFTLYTGGENAWSYPEDQAQLIAAMRAGIDMVVKGTSSRGTLTTDTYSLRGFTATKQAIDAACGL